MTKPTFFQKGITNVINSFFPFRKPMQLLIHLLLSQPLVLEASSVVARIAVYPACRYTGQIPCPWIMYLSFFTNILYIAGGTCQIKDLSLKLSLLNNNNLTPFFSLTLNSLMEISWHYPKAFSSWAELSRQKPKTATPQEFEQRKGF